MSTRAGRAAVGDEETAFNPPPGHAGVETTMSD